MPLATGISGFFPSFVVMAICCAAMTATGLLLIEASLWFEEGAHIHTITSRILGPFGKAVAWVLYLFICYASLVAYVSAGGEQIAGGLSYWAAKSVGPFWGYVCFVLVFGAVLVFGNRWIGRINALLFAAMVLAYLMLVGVAFDEVKPSFLAYQQWGLSWIATPMLLTTFSYQTMVPSLTPYLNRDVRALRSAVIGGNLVTILIYSLWQMVMLGIIPVEGEHGLRLALVNIEIPTNVLGAHVTGRWIWAIAEFFAFFAIATSFLGISLGLIDFLSDGIHVSEKRWGWVLLLALVLVPTFLFVLKFEKIFLSAMDASGGIGDSILNGIMPVLIIWIGRYKRKISGESLLQGGKAVLILLMIFFVGTLTVEILSLTGQINPYYEPYDVIELPGGQIRT